MTDNRNVRLVLNHQTWTEAEVDMLRSMLADHWPAAEIAFQMARTSASIVSKARALRIPVKPIKPPRFRDGLDM